MSTQDTQLARLLTLIPYLAARPHASIRDVAARFDVTPAQVVRDVKLIWMCGLPGYFPGDLIDVEVDGDRVTVTNAMEVSKPLRLTAVEAASLILALRSLAASAAGESAAAIRALAKLESAVGDTAEALASVEVPDLGEPAIRAAISEALANNHRLHLTYYVPRRDEETIRDVDPLGVVIADGRAYLRGYCLSADGVRLFRLDRIRAATVTDVACVDHPEPQAPTFTDYTPGPDDVPVRLRLGASARWVLDEYACEDVVTIDDDVEVTLWTADTGWVLRLLLSLGSAGRVISPEWLSERVSQTAEAIRALYPESTGLSRNG